MLDGYAKERHTVSIGEVREKGGRVEERREG